MVRVLPPLPLTLFEEFMLLDGPLPMDIWVEAGFTEALSRPPLEEAVRQLARRHPLLTSRVEERHGRRCWVATGNEIPVHFLGAHAAVPRVPLAPTDGVGMRVYTRARALYLQVHHACCDGSAARVLLQDLAQAYARASRPVGPWPEPMTLDVERLAQRGRLTSTAPDLPAPPRLKLVRDVLEFLFPFPRALAAQPGTDEVADPPYSLRVLDGDETAAVMEAARASVAGRFHEKALSDFFGTLGAWQRRQGEARGRIRVTIPWDMRTLSDRRMPACNHITFAFLNRPAVACAGDLSGGLRAEHEYIREFRTDLDFLRGLELMRGLGVLRSLLRLPVCMSTGVFTNMGNATPVRGFSRTPNGVEVGDNECVYATGVPPVRHGTFASLGLCRLGDRLGLAWRSDRGHLGQDAERWLLDEFTRRLEAGGTPAPH